MKQRAAVRSGSSEMEACRMKGPDRTVGVGSLQLPPSCEQRQEAEEVTTAAGEMRLMSTLHSPVERGSSHRMYDVGRSAQYDDNMLRAPAAPSTPVASTENVVCRS